MVFLQPRRAPLLMLLRVMAEMIDDVSRKKSYSLPLFEWLCVLPYQPFPYVVLTGMIDEGLVSQAHSH